MKQPIPIRPGLLPASTPRERACAKALTLAGILELAVSHSQNLLNMGDDAPIGMRNAAATVGREAARQLKILNDIVARLDAE